MVDGWATLIVAAANELSSRLVLGNVVFIIEQIFFFPSELVKCLPSGHASSCERQCWQLSKGLLAGLSIPDQACTVFKLVVSRRPYSPRLLMNSRSLYGHSTNTSLCIAGGPTDFHQLWD
eukprot:jgi/Botrbrau1/19897/Bobra.0059s0018.1